MQQTAGYREGVSSSNLKASKKLKNYDFLDAGVNDGFEHKPCTILTPNEDIREFEIMQMERGFTPYKVKTRVEATIFQ
ncbi:hypothetical protein MUGA111182_10735 [Mucilaginibacter galii]|uniref:Uncharacterized protein n=1 Tax=Mucilaginibacter galii TaxID=2005073 RepID=A0A917J8J8_9SPHI|nr:hypothetical protein [Mucilaginibacter galii]GGI50743.1 hypothetical protein GCM10011425_19550 [Mucilaginibacter galii]